MKLRPYPRYERLEFGKRSNRGRMGGTENNLWWSTFRLGKQGKVCFPCTAIHPHFRIGPESMGYNKRCRFPFLPKTRLVGSLYRQKPHCRSICPPHKQRKFVWYGEDQHRSESPFRSLSRRCTRRSLHNPLHRLWSYREHTTGTVTSEKGHTFLERNFRSRCDLHSRFCHRYTYHNGRHPAMLSTSAHHRCNLRLPSTIRS